MESSKAAEDRSNSNYAPRQIAGTDLLRARLLRSVHATKEDDVLETKGWKPRSRALRSLAVGYLLVATISIAACDEYSLGPGDGPPPVPATVELLDGRVYAASNAYVWGKNLAESTEIQLAFEGSEITVSAGCRSAASRLQVSDGLFRASNLEFSGDTCSNELTRQEIWLQKFLEGPIHAELHSEEAGVLSLWNRKISMEMGALEMDEPDQGRLESDYWRLRRVITRNDETSPVVIGAPGLDKYNKSMPFANSIPSLSMYEGDQFDFTTGCGVLTGTFEHDESSITFTTRNRSDENCSAQREKFRAKVAPLFDGSFNYRFDGPDLILTQGATELRFFSG